MAISGDALRDFTFKDENGADVKVTLSIKDGINFKLLERIGLGLTKLQETITK